MLVLSILVAALAGCASFNPQSTIEPRTTTKDQHDLPFTSGWQITHKPAVLHDETTGNHPYP
jgi:hypothetical protein